MKMRVFSTIVLWTLVLVVIFTDWLPGYYLFFCSIPFIGLLEYYQLLEKQGARLAHGSACLAALTLQAGTIFLYTSKPSFFTESPFLFSVAIVTILSVWVLFASLWRSGERSPLETVGGTLSGFIYVPWLWHFLSLLVFAVPGLTTKEGGHLLLYLLIVTKFTDMGALLTGMAFGRHKMSPKISPKKTWEGFAGGIVLSVASSFALKMILGDNLPVISVASSIYLGLILALSSVAGDLAESLLKRGANIKDSGSIVPGIGGVLDLIDSLLFTAPILYLYLRFTA
ncbi:MAG: phosphatidate cytidylyltransferase [Verrucomicrobiota bacterium]|nr:phosphatidate cytidylyltransferase [Verrucomicrobiota bacterium]